MSSPTKKSFARVARAHGRALKRVAEVEKTIGILNNRVAFLEGELTRAQVASPRRVGKHSALAAPYGGPAARLRAKLAHEARGRERAKAEGRSRDGRY